MCILTTVAGCAATRYGVTLMSSNEYRSVNDFLPQSQKTSDGQWDSWQ